jgi:hypothetical protein
MQIKQHSSRKPTALTTITTMFSHPLLIRGDPYHVYRMQLYNAIAYGKPEKLSVLLIWITFLNVVLFRVKILSSFINTMSLSAFLI